MAPQPYFPRKTFVFLKDLAANNDRDWFQENKARFEEARDLALAFVSDFEPALERVSEHFLADARKTGGSLFRIHRDTRFSADKTPYKTHLSMQFRHESGKDVHCPGYYLHIEPGNCMAGVGIWHPDSPTLAKIRDAISEDPGGWKKAALGSKLAAKFEQATEDRLKRPPRGYDPEHPMVEELKRKDYCAMAKLDQKTVGAATLPRDLAKLYSLGTPMMRFLCDAIGIPF